VAAAETSVAQRLWRRVGLGHMRQLQQAGDVADGEIWPTLVRMSSSMPMALRSKIATPALSSP
jgi:hypothetical protein